LAENRDFVRVEAGLFSGFARKDAWEAYLQDLLRQPEGLLQRAAIQVVKDSKGTTVGAADGLGAKLYIKRYNYQGIPYAIKDLFRSSRARRTWVAANSLHMRDIPVALPLAYLEKRRFGILLESYFVTEAVTGTNLRQTFNRYDTTGAGQKEKRALVHALARVVKKMHAHGVSHRDLKANNIVAQERAPHQFDLFIVDFDGIRIGAVSWHRRAKDLARLVRETQRHSCFSLSDRVRFLKTYLGGKEKEWKTAWASMAKKR
jgi:tRNA A-37 threonylcarbamoyl transferase component Bud32